MLRHVSAGLAREGAVLGAEVTGRSPSQASRVARVRPLTKWTSAPGSEARPLEQLTDLGGRRGESRMRRELAQRAVVVEQQRAPAGLGELPRDPGLRAVVEPGRRSAASAAAAKRSSRSQEVVRPSGRQSSATTRSAISSSRRCRSAGSSASACDEPVGEVARVPRVDEQRARQHVGGAGELAQEQRSLHARAPAPARSGRGRTPARPGSCRRGAASPSSRLRAGRARRAPAVETGGGGTRSASCPSSPKRPFRWAIRSLDLVALGLVVGALEPRRDEHLEQRRRLGPLGVLLEDPLERVELLAGCPSCSRAARRRGRAACRGSARSSSRLGSAPSPGRASVVAEASRRRCRSGCAPIPIEPPVVLDLSGSDSIPRTRRQDERKWRT